MAAKRSAPLPPPPTDGAAPPRRQPALEMRVRIPGDLVERLDLLALQDNRDRRRQAALRHGALEAHGCSTYERGTRGGQQAIICLCCGLGSAHPKDIRERYCGFCDAFHADWREL